MLLWTVVMALVAIPAQAATAPTDSATLQDHAALLDRALAAFDRATQLASKNQSAAKAAYREAAGGFEALIADGVRNGKLYYNLGNTYLQLGDLGKAIVNYRRAEALLGSDAQLEANLHFARSLCRSQIQAAGGQAALRTALFWHYDTSLRARFWTALGAWVLFWIALGLRTATRASGWGYAAAILAVIWLSAGLSTTVEWWQRTHTQYGVTVSDDITVRKGNGAGYEPQFNEPLHEGVEFEVLDERPGWYKVELRDGSSGWLQQTQAEII